MTVQELKQSLESGHRPVLVDVRSAGEFAAGHVPGAINIPMDEAEARIEDIPASTPVVVVCQSGNRAQVTCELIREERPNVQVLEGGTDAWIAAGMHAVCSRRTRWSIERQVRLTAGLIVLAGTILAITVNPAWIYLAMFIGAGLTFAGLTNLCGMAALYAQMPWNKPKRSALGAQGAEAR